MKYVNKNSDNEIFSQKHTAHPDKISTTVLDKRLHDEIVRNFHPKKMTKDKGREGQGPGIDATLKVSAFPEAKLSLFRYPPIF